MNFSRIVVFLTIAASTSFSVSAAEKLYDNIFFTVKTDDAILIPSTLDKDMLKLTSRRLVEFGNDRAEEKGDFTVVTECKPKTLNVTLDIVSITSSVETAASRSFFGGSVTASEKKNFSLALTSTVRDCTTGKLLFKNANSDDRTEPLEVFRSLVNDSVKDALKQQYSSGYR